jgi:hypothetical protein
VRRASKKLDVPKTNVWQVLQKFLHVRPYRLQILKQLKLTDKIKRYDFCCNFLEKLSDDDTIMKKLIFRDEVTFDPSGRVNRRILRIWDSKNRHESFEHERNSPKVSVSVVMSREKL